MADLINCLDEHNSLECMEFNCTTMCREFIATGNYIKLLSLNIRSINKNYNDLLILLQQFQNIFDVIILTECWINNHYVPKIIQGFDSYYTKCVRLQNDGVVVYIKSSINAMVTEPSLDDANCLHLILDDCLHIFAIYKSPSIQNVSNFLQSLDNLLSKYGHESNIIITGDININIINEKHKQADDYLNLLAHHGLRVAINKPTRVDGLTISCIDHFMIKSKMLIKSFIYETTITDHFATGITISKEQKIQNNNNETVCRLNTDYSMLIERLRKSNWSPVLKTDDAEVAAEQFLNIYTECLTSSTSKNVTKISRSRIKLKPWITDGLMFSIRKRDNIHKQVRHNPNDIQLLSFYKRYRNVCTRLIKNARESYYKEKITQASGDMKKTWRIIKDIAFGKSVKAEIKTIKVNQVSKTFDDNPDDILNHTNEYFTNIGCNLAQNIIRDLRTSELELADCVQTAPKCQNQFKLTPTNKPEVINIIKSLRNDCATGEDMIQAKSLKDSAEIIWQPLVHMINLSFITGVFPRWLKSAQIKPIYKAGSKDDINNYRPISLLSIISKIYEKLVKIRLTTHLENNNLLSPNQYGFRQGRGTNEAINTVNEYIAKNIDSGRKAMAIFLDLSKAFDTVSHIILLKKLISYGISDKELKWFSSYLEERTQSTTINNQASEKLNVTFGVPQGSVLGPLLFLVYVNDLCDLPINGQITSFADDTVLLVNARSWEEAFSIAQTNINIVKYWLDRNVLTLNALKTNYITFSLRCSDSSHIDRCLKIHAYACTSSIHSCSCKLIKRVTESTYLGITIDERMNWESQVTKLTARTRKLVYAFLGLRNILSFATTKMVYKSLCQSLWIHGIIAWGACTKQVLDPLLKAQKLVLRVIGKKHQCYSSVLLFEEFQVLQIKQIFVKQILVFFQKHPQNWRKSQQALATRAAVSTNYLIPLVKTTFAQRQMYFMAPKIFNSIDDKLKKITNIDRFKFKINRWLIEFGYLRMENELLKIII